MIASRRWTRPAPPSDHSPSPSGRARAMRLRIRAQRRRGRARAVAAQLAAEAAHRPRSSSGLGRSRMRRVRTRLTSPAGRAAAGAAAAAPAQAQVLDRPTQRPRSPPRSAATGAARRHDASARAPRRSGHRRPASGSRSWAVHAVARGQEAVLVEHLGRVDERRARALPSASSRTRPGRARSARPCPNPGLGVHDADLDRPEARLQADVPPHERRLGERAAADEQVDGLDLVGVGGERARDADARERRTAACARTPGRCRGPARTASWPTARAGAAGGRACGSAPAIAASGSGMRDVDVQRERRLAPGELAHRVVDLR